MKHTIKTPQGSVSMEAIGQKGDPQVLLTIQKAGIPIPFPFPVSVEHAQLAHSALGMVLKELEPKAPSECLRTGGFCQCTGVCKAQKAVAA